MQEEAFKTSQKCDRYTDRIRLPWPKKCTCGRVNTHSEIIAILAPNGDFWFLCDCGSSHMFPKKRMDKWKGKKMRLKVSVGKKVHYVEVTSIREAEITKSYLERTIVDVVVTIEDKFFIKRVKVLFGIYR